METLLQDLRYGLRMLAKGRALTGIAVLTLALGIGANTAMFSVVSGVLLRPLPYQQPERLVRVFTVFPTQPIFSLAKADFVDFRARNHVFTGMALFARRDLDLTVGDKPERLKGMGVTPDFFRVLGFHPMLGRDFQSNEEYKGNTHVVILSYRLWQSRFGADPQIVGKSLMLSSEPFTVVGVMPPGVQHVGGDYHSLPHGDNVELWWPLEIQPLRGARDRNQHYLNAIARLKPGVTLEQANAEMNVVVEEIAKENPDTNKDARSKVVLLKEEIVGRARAMLLVLLGAAGFVLLIACVNVANLMLARAAARRREMAVRSVLGAGRLRLIRQLLTESALLALLGGALGWLVAYWGVDALLALSPDKLPRLQAVHMDGRVLGFTLVVALLTAVLFGLAPAVETLKTNPNESLKEGERGTTSGSARARLRSVLVTAEVALALVLLIGAGLLLRSFVALQHVEPGFRPDHVLTMAIDLPDKRYPEMADAARFYERLLERVRALPGVQSAGIASDIPWTGYDENSNFDIEGRPPEPGHEPEGRYHFVTPGYFEAIGTPLLGGRFFTAADNADAPKVVLVNSALARRYFPGEDAVGKRLELWGLKGVTIVGVVGDVKDTPDALEAKPAYYWPTQQMVFAGMFLAVRSASDPAVLTDAVRREVLALDKDLPVTDARTLEDTAVAAVAGARFTLLLVGAFAGVALILAMVGIYGVMAYTVTQRTHEIGVRMALGAQARDVLKLILSQGLRLTLLGVTVGLAAAFAVTRALSSLLYGVKAADPATFVAVALLLAAVALVACFIPARRATQVDPIVALRYE